MLSVYGSREMPCPCNLKCIVLDVDKFKFLVKPATAVSMMHSGLIPKHKFWSQMSILDIYTGQIVSPVTVLSMIEEPNCSTPNEKCMMIILNDL